MYPNPQEALPLPPRPDLNHYRKRAKDLARACASGDPSAIGTWAERWIRDLAELHAEGDRERKTRDSARYAGKLAAFAANRLGANDCSLSQAQFVIARAHGFESWPKLAHHIEAILEARTPVSAFEEAADAIVAGDRATIERLLHEDPSLIRARSSREHRATLLHYVAANGVENYRQETPANIVEIARLLLDAGAEVDAEAEMYGGGATTLGLTVTSAHPRIAGVQIPLAELLLERGARISERIVGYCLMNGCPEAAAYMAERGAPVGLGAAAGIGRLDMLEKKFDAARSFDDPAWRQEVGDAVIGAIWYDHEEIVSYLLDRGFDPATKVTGFGEIRTALHLASSEGRVSIVELLLRRGAPVNITDDVHHATPMLWALYAWTSEKRRNLEPYPAIVRMLLNAGATVEAEWFDDDVVRAVPELFEALTLRAGENRG